MLREMNEKRARFVCSVSYPPKVSVSALVKSLKEATSRRESNVFSEINASFFKRRLWTSP